jgi:hypothetical protein
MIKTSPTKLAAAAAALAALTLGLTPSSASATTADGSWWSAHYNCSGVDVQLHYINDRKDNLTRTDGFAAHVSWSSGYLDRVEVDEIVAASARQVGNAAIWWTAGSHSPVKTGFPTAWLPWVRPAERPYARVTLWGQDHLENGKILVWPTSITCPMIDFGH